MSKPSDRLWCISACRVSCCNTVYCEKKYPKCLEKIDQQRDHTHARTVTAAGNMVTTVFFSHQSLQKNTAFRNTGLHLEHAPQLTQI